MGSVINAISRSGGSYASILVGGLQESGNTVTAVSPSGKSLTARWYTPPRLPAHTISQSCYMYMFSFSGIVCAPYLPATSIPTQCYYDMFFGCNHLTIAQDNLPGLGIGQDAYSGMFSECTSLIKCPSISATNVQYRGCMGMFAGCTSLQYVPKLYPDGNWNADEAYETMFYGCTSLYVSDTQTEQASHEWKIPYEQTVLYEYTYEDTFTNCLGTRASDNLIFTEEQQKTYYTQYEPV